MLSSSTLYSGQSYQLPSGDFQAGDQALGQTALNTDNTRIAALQERAVQASLASAPPDSFSGALYRAEQSGQSQAQAAAQETAPADAGSTINFMAANPNAYASGFPTVGYVAPTGAQSSAPIEVVPQN